MPSNGNHYIGMIALIPTWQILPDRNTDSTCIPSLTHQRVQTQLFAIVASESLRRCAVCDSWFGN
nr:MAG TPA: hypothetical protein [Caudoviricetes sp.]